MNKFDQLYKKYEDLVSEGTFDGDARDKVDTIETEVAALTTVESILKYTYSFTTDAE